MKFTLESQFYKIDYLLSPFGILRLQYTDSNIINIMKNINYPIEEELLNWYSLTPGERWNESRKLWDFYISMGGSLDPEPDTQSPFHAAFQKGKTCSLRFAQAP
ncbi:MAG TPA: hypothetical protein DCZ94_21165 [Lentisphaeria bacterium]|nr:hypothetical protein [Lentisphaeria bacterium]